MRESSANAPAKLSHIRPNQQVTVPQHELAVTRRKQAMRESDRSLGRYPALDDKVVDKYRATERIRGQGSADSLPSASRTGHAEPGEQDTQPSMIESSGLCRYIQAVSCHINIHQTLDI